MRSAWKCGGFALMLAFTGSVSAQEKPLYVATVTQPEAEVRCKPGNGPIVYATNKLRKGDRVQVVRELPDKWLEIVPPPGSFSWINKRFLQQLGKDTWLVTALDDAPAQVLYGSALKNEKPTAWSVKVPRGTQVRSIGAQMTDSDGIWLPIEPPPTEYRYLRTDAVARDAAPVATATPAVHSWNQPPVANFQNQGGAVPLVPAPREDRLTPAPQAPVNPQWAEAERAEREGRINDAVTLYTQLGQAEANRDHELSMRCYNRASWLRSNYAGGRPAEARYPYQNDTRLRPVAAGDVNSATACYVPPPCCTPCPQDTSVRQGRLRQAGRSLDYKPTYVLETTQGQIISYVTAQQGVNLEPYVGRSVELAGPMNWRGDVRSNFMTASRVTPVQ